jgi:glycosyltransferase involved in cell wall biosynthesis
MIAAQGADAVRAGRRLRVLHIIQNLNYGGMERLLADIVLRADPQRIESHVLCLQYLGRFAEGLEEVAELHLAKPLRRLSMVWPAQLVQQIRAIGPDVVHTHSGVWYKATHAARLAGVRWLVHTEHGRHRPDPLPGRLIDGIAARRTDVVVAVSGALAEELVGSRIVPRKRLRVVRNGVDTQVYAPRDPAGDLRRELGISPQTPILGSIGRLERIKGYDIAVEAFARLRKKWSAGPAPVVVVVGEGSERPRLEKRVRQLGLADAVFLLGWRDGVARTLSEFTLFTASSRSEGTSVSLLEAMSAGLCPVVTDVGGNAAVLGSELAHRLVPSEDAETLADAWIAALRDQGRRHKDAQAARRRVEANFGLEAMVREYESIYMEAGRADRRVRALH